jgi:2-polyprenyl-6-hydroxyphenyl methylase/3-demethylubiquinone-9 3-methyltransferase
MSPQNGELQIDNQLYNDLGSQWYLAQDNPVALLRAESRLRNPWVIEVIRDSFGQTDEKGIKILDIGCGGGFLSNELARAGYRVDGVDLSESSLKVAQDYDDTKTVHYHLADASRLPFAPETFEVVCAMDFLEHVEDPAPIIAEIARVLKPGGIFFFHTFNKNPLAGLVVIRGVEWFVKNTPPRMHIYRLFIRPRTLQKICAERGVIFKEVRGCRPKLWSKSFWKMLWTREVPPEFEFVWTRARTISYTGYARKN